MKMDKEFGFYLLSLAKHLLGPSNLFVASHAISAVQYFQGIIVRHGGSTEQIIVHRAQSDNNHDGIMDLAQHSDHSN